MMIEKCPNCNSIRTRCIAHHNNRRKKIPIYLYQCDNCKKRFTIKGDKNHYNHKGNIHQRKPRLYKKIKENEKYIFV